MRSPLRLSAIEQEHLQELYNASGVSRDELPYTEQFDHLCREFEGRAFKHAEPDRVYLSLLKYTRSSTCKSSEIASPVPAEHIPHLQAVLARYGAGGKLAPYSTEFQNALRDFQARTNHPWTEREFWLAICGMARAKRGSGRRKPTEAILPGEEDALAAAPQKEAEPRKARRAVAVPHPEA